MDIEVILYDGKKEMGFRVNFPVVPRIGEVLWLHTGSQAAAVTEKFSHTEFVVKGVYYHFYDGGNGAYIEAEPFRP